MCPRGLWRSGLKQGTGDPEAHWLYVYHWLSLGSERMAVDSLFSLLRERVPGIFLLADDNLAYGPSSCDLHTCVAEGRPPDPSRRFLGGDDLRAWAGQGALGVARRAGRRRRVAGRHAEGRARLGATAGLMMRTWSRTPEISRISSSASAEVIVAPLST